jgi:hypothetical protein
VVNIKIKSAVLQAFSDDTTKFVTDFLGKIISILFNAYK